MGQEAGLATVEGTCELPLEAVVVDVDVVLRSISAVAVVVVLVSVVRSSIFALTLLSVRLLCVSVRVVGSSSVAGVGGVWEKMYELGEGTNVALAKRAAVETEGSMIAAMDGLSCFFLLRRDFGRSALVCQPGVNDQLHERLILGRELTRDPYDMLDSGKLVVVA